MAKMDIEVDTAAVWNIRNASFSEYQDTLMAQYQAMSTAIEALNATWEGPNHDAFVASFVSRSKGIEAFHNVLREYLFALSSACDQYDECESTVAEYVASSGSIGG